MQAQVIVRGVSSRYRPLWMFAERLGGFVTPYGPNKSVEVILNANDAMLFAEEANRYADSVEVRNLPLSARGGRS